MRLVSRAMVRWSDGITATLTTEGWRASEALMTDILNTSFAPDLRPSLPDPLRLAADNVVAALGATLIGLSFDELPDDAIF